MQYNAEFDTAVKLKQLLSGLDNIYEMIAIDSLQFYRKKLIVNALNAKSLTPTMDTKGL